MDKIQAQRAVFQLRRKAVNSAKSRPVVNRKCRCAGPEHHPAEGHDPGCMFIRVQKKGVFGDGVFAGGDAAKSPDAYALVKTACEHWYNIGWPEDEKPVAMLLRALELLKDPPEECRACDGRGWLVTDEDTANEAVQGTRECPVCQPSVSKAKAPQ